MAEFLKIVDFNVTVRALALTLILAAGPALGSEVAHPPEAAWRPGQPLPTFEPDEKPFWRKPKVYAKISEERSIPVAVTATSNFRSGPAPHRLTMAGAARVNAPRRTTYGVLRDFDRLKEISSVIRDVKWDASRQILFMHCEAFGYHARMWFEIDFREAPELRRSDLKFRIRQGTFQGMSGVVRVEEVSAEATDLTLASEYFYSELPVPKMFVSFGLEVVLQKIAARVRAEAESRKSEGERRGA